MAWLTKSLFLAGAQCPKRLWLEVHRPLPRDALVPLPVLEGRRVDARVRALWPGLVIPRDAGLEAALARTAEALAAGIPARVYQPAFRAGERAVIADILEARAGSVTLTEVKASTGVRPEHLVDVGYQALVLRGAGVAVDRVQVMHLDPGFVLRRAEDYEGLVHAADVTPEVERRLPELDAAAEALAEVMAQPREPVVRTGPHCELPYACPYFDYCRRQEGSEPAYPLEVLKRAPALVRALRVAGYRDLREVPEERLQSDTQRRIHRATLSDEPFIDRAAARAITGLAYPVAYVDFETLTPAIPDRVGARPYQSLPFQFSVHVEESSTDVRHAEFLAAGLPVDLEALAATLVAAIPEEGAVLAYNAGFEEGVLRALAAAVPPHAAALHAIADRLIDLLPITRRAYYHPAMKGSWSFKAVLPTIDASLDYAALEGVREGSQAQLAFLESIAEDTPPERRAALRGQLRRYCGRDTYGMIVLRRFLAGE